MTDKKMDVLTRIGYSKNESKLLLALDTATDPQTPTEIGNLTAVSMNAVYTSIRRLHANGIVSSNSDSKSRKTYALDGTLRDVVANQLIMQIHEASEVL